MFLISQRNWQVTWLQIFCQTCPASLKHWSNSGLVTKCFTLDMFESLHTALPGFRPRSPHPSFKFGIRVLSRNYQNHKSLINNSNSLATWSWTSGWDAGGHGDLPWRQVKLFPQTSLKQWSLKQWSNSDLVTRCCTLDVYERAVHNLNSRPCCPAASVTSESAHWPAWAQAFKFVSHSEN